ncbi:MAG: hypothetical protein R3318_07085, partial [Gammaproteobacteria bacterium]|nr:hypothetical protein [Gammaproteobacteria bacterium]
MTLPTVSRLTSRNWPLVALLMLAGACTTVPVDETDPASIEPQNEVLSTTATTDEDAGPTRLPPARPKIELTEEILYKLLLAEFAGHRGKLDISVRNYLELARSTRDPEVVERATRIAVYARDDEAAREAASLWVEIDPDSVDAHQVLAVMSVRDGDIEKALEHLNILLDNSSGKIDQKLWMIANLLGREDDQSDHDQKIVLTVM